MAKAKVFASKFILSLGRFHVQGSLLPMRAPNWSKATSLKNLCPTCAAEGTITVPQQVYICPEGHGPFKDAAMQKGIETAKDKYALLSKEQVEKIREPETLGGLLVLSVHPAEEVERYTWPDSGCYVFQPDATKLNQTGGALLSDLVAETDLAFVGIANIRKQEYMVRLTRSRDNCLVLQTLVWPEGVAEREPLTGSYDASHLEAALRLVEQETTPFDPNHYEFRARKAHADIAGSALGSTISGHQAEVAEQHADDTDSLLAMLGESLQAAAGQ